MLLDPDAAEPRQPANLGLRIRHAEQVIAEGLATDSRDQFVLAALEYQSILADPDFDGNDPHIAEIQASLGALLCLIAQGEPAGPTSIEYLDRAQILLGKALDRCSRTATPLAWARMRADLTIVLLTRFEQTRTPAELFMALVTIDGVAEVFEQAGDTEAEGWVRGISQRLNSLRGQRR